MKRILRTIVSLGVLGLESSALASAALGADLPLYSKAAPLPAYDWSGFYVGLFGGGGFGNHNINDNLGNFGAANYTANYSSQGGIGGGEAGFNAQSGLLLVGIEAQGFWSGIKGNDTSFIANSIANGTALITSVDQDSLRWGGSLVARGGLTFDRLLLFFEGGWAFGDIEHINTDPVLGVDKFTVHANGLTAGGGIAYAITNNLIGKVDYRYYNFNGYNRPGTPLTANGQLPYTTESTYSTITVGLDYKFGFGGPVVAKY